MDTYNVFKKKGKVGTCRKRNRNGNSDRRIRAATVCLPDFLKSVRV